jgi:hypothetical protein
VVRNCHSRRVDGGTHHRHDLAIIDVQAQDSSAPDRMRSLPAWFAAVPVLVGDSGQAARERVEILGPS